MLQLFWVDDYCYIVGYRVCYWILQGPNGCTVASTAGCGWECVDVEYFWMCQSQSLRLALCLSAVTVILGRRKCRRLLGNKGWIRGEWLIENLLVMDYMMKRCTLVNYARFYTSFVNYQCIDKGHNGLGQLHLIYCNTAAAARIRILNNYSFISKQSPSPVWWCIYLFSRLQIFFVVVQNPSVLKMLTCSHVEICQTIFITKRFKESYVCSIEFMPLTSTQL